MNVKVKSCLLKWIFQCNDDDDDDDNNNNNNRGDKPHL